MATIQWIIAAITAGFVALIGYLQWRTAQNKAVLDLFEKRREIYEVIRKSVGQIMSSSTSFDQQREVEFVEAMERAYFFFGKDVEDYLDMLWNNIIDVRTMDSELPGLATDEERRENRKTRRVAINRVGKFYREGMPLFARYMRFPQKVPGYWWSRPSFKRR